MQHAKCISSFSRSLLALHLNNLIAYKINKLGRRMHFPKIKQLSSPPPLAPRTAPLPPSPCHCRAFLLVSVMCRHQFSSSTSSSLSLFVHLLTLNDRSDLVLIDCPPRLIDSSTLVAVKSRGATPTPTTVHTVGCPPT